MAYSEPIFAADFADFESYVAGIQREWDAQWKRISMADWAGAASGAAALLRVCYDAWPMGARSSYSGSC